MCLNHIQAPTGWPPSQPMLKLQVMPLQHDNVSPGLRNVFVSPPAMHERSLNASVAAMAQHDPHDDWSRTCPTIPAHCGHASRASNDAGMALIGVTNDVLTSRSFTSTYPAIPRTRVPSKILKSAGVAVAKRGLIAAFHVFFSTALIASTSSLFFRSNELRTIESGTSARATRWRRKNHRTRIIVSKFCCALEEEGRRRGVDRT